MTAMLENLLIDPTRGLSATISMTCLFRSGRLGGTADAQPEALRHRFVTRKTWARRGEEGVTNPKEMTREIKFGSKRSVMGPVYIARSALTTTAILTLPKK
jgi:hypothetical protein